MTIIERKNKYSNIFEYFPPNIDICIQFVVIFNAEYYSNIRIFCPNISKYWSLKIRGNAGIKEVLFSFFTWKDTFSTKSKSYNNLILVWLYLEHWAFTQNTTFFWYFNKSFIFALKNYLKIFEYLALFEYYSNIFHNTNNISYLIRSILLRQIIFDIRFGPK